MVGLAEVFVDLERVINSLISWEYQRPRCGWGYIETRRPCKGYPKRSFWQRLLLPVERPMPEVSSLPRMGAA